MKNTLTDLSKEVFKKDVMGLLNDRYSVIGPIWTNQQMEWSNGIYRTFNDHDKYMIVVYLIKKTLDFYSKNFIKLNYDEFYSQDTIAIGKFNITDISFSLNIPKETTRRKINELEKLGAIKNLSKKIIVHKSVFPLIKPIKATERMSRFLAKLSVMLSKRNILPRVYKSEEIKIVLKNNFSYVWKIYYEMQIPMLLNWKNIFLDLETWHIWGTCAANQSSNNTKLNDKKFSNSMNKENFINKIIFSNSNTPTGVNAMSISDITGIPRATVIRKLQHLIKKDYLTVDEKKQYRLTGNHSKKIMEVQKITINRLANFSTIIYNMLLAEGLKNKEG